MAMHEQDAPFEIGDLVVFPKLHSPSNTPFGIVTRIRPEAVYIHNGTYERAYSSQDLLRRGVIKSRLTLSGFTRLINDVQEEMYFEEKECVLSIELI